MIKLNKIPATIVTGFLGSGKTTLLSKILEQANGKRIAVIVNEFGELDIDAELLKSCPLECKEEESGSSSKGIYELANGCICCTVEEEFLPVMQELVARRDTIDHILIETSGLALPKPLVQAFNWPDISQYCTVDAVITLVDGPAVAAGRFAHDERKVESQRLMDSSLDHDPTLRELFNDQLSSADLVLIGKNDLLSEEERKRVYQLVTDQIPKAVKTVLVSHGDFINEELPLEVLLGIEAATESRIDQVFNHHDHHHEQGTHHDHAHDHFDSSVICLGEVDGQALKNILQKLIKEHAIYRAKGFAALPGKPMRQVIQAVGERLEVHFDRMWREDETRQTRIVVIGKNLDFDALCQALQTAELVAVV